ncbi:3-oxoacyl-ACP synthase [Aerococcaceae bacterium NML130460]|nr:3-oxoacyl-ACP synthase [Aerococcaceae bacterium NML130460]
MRNIKIIGYGGYLPKNTVEFNGETRYWCTEEETQLDMAAQACLRALEQANIGIEEIDCIVSASAVPVQPIPCTAALIHEKIALGTDIPAFDINSTCTSFVTALDTMSYLIHGGKYNRVLIVSSELASMGLNENQKESYELFSDGACAFIIEKSDNPIQGVIASMQKTWSEGAHMTEIRGGLTGLNASFYSEETREDYLFSMDGKRILSISAKKLPPMFDEFTSKYNVRLDEVDLVVPHQASRALALIMKKLGIREDQYINLVKDYGNQVSVSIPYMLYHALQTGRAKENNTVLLCGTAAGLTSNMLLLRL